MTTLPHVDRAVIEAAKVRDYLLSDSHPIGRFKAAFFAALGDSQSEWRTLEEGLRRHAADGEARAAGSSPHGQTYEVRGSLKGPNGREARLTAVWIILTGDDPPRFVTAYPGATR